MPKKKKVRRVASASKAHAQAVSGPSPRPAPDYAPSPKPSYPQNDAALVMNDLLARNAALEQALLEALVYVEDALEDPAFKKGFVRKLSDRIRKLTGGGK